MGDATLKVVHWGTGNTGSVVLRQVLDDPRLELVGLGVRNPDKAGRDAGTFCGRAATGVRATTDWNALLRLQADCATYIVNEWDRPPSALLDELCALLASGKNVVSTSYLPLIYPKSLGDDVVRRLEAACEAGGSSYHCTGIEPGFTGDVLPLVLSSLSSRVDAIRFEERINVAQYDEPVQLQGYGIGRTVEEDAAAYHPGHMRHLWAGTFRMVADALGVTIDDIREHREVATVAQDVRLPHLHVAWGRIGGIRFLLEGMVAGRPRITISHVYTVDDACAAHWPPRVAAEQEGTRFTRIAIDGDPPMTLTLALGGPGLDPTVMGVTGTASRAVNAIRVVCAAPPGIRTFLDLPPVVAHGRMRA
jgi:4-hydroxy-tetrahydrodipicolinate reductase